MQAAFWKPGADNPSAQAGLDRTSATSAATLTLAPHIHNKHRHLSLREQQGRLPIAAHRQELLYALERHRVVIIAGETGCGKSTQVPRYLHEAGWTARGRSVLCTQPRGLSVMATAARVADELGETSIGGLVGFSTMHDNRTSAHTRLRFCTDRYLVRELLFSPLLVQCSVVMIDEAHERHPHTDLLLGLFRKLLCVRDDLRLIVASATLDVPLFVDFFRCIGRHRTNLCGQALSRTLHMDMPRGFDVLCDVVALSVGKRQHAIDIQFLTAPCADYLGEAVKTVVKIHETEKPGAILVFVADRRDVEMVVRELQSWDDSGGSASGGAAFSSSLATAAAVMGSSRYRLSVLPLHSGLSSREQIAALRRARAGERKVVVATGIAESSITIDDIVYVVDSCFDRIRTYDSSTGLGAIVTCPVSQASARQRAGRAGRTRPGKCFRLTTLESYRNLRVSSIPAIRRSDLTEIVLQLKALGVEDVLHFPFLSPPPVSALAHSLEMLYALGALDEQCRLTRPVGAAMADFPCSPQMARMLLASYEAGCTEDILSLAAMLSLYSVFAPCRTALQSRTRDAIHREFAAPEGDHTTLIGILHAFENAHDQQAYASENALSLKALRRALHIRSDLGAHLSRAIPEATSKCLVSKRSNKCAGKNVTDAHAEKDKLSMNSRTSPEKLLRCVLSGFFAHTARLHPSGNYETLRGGILASLGSNSVLHKFPPNRPANWVVFYELQATNEEYLIHDVSCINPLWVTEAAPHFFERSSREGAGTGPVGQDNKSPKTDASALRRSATSAVVGSGGHGLSAVVGRKRKRIRKKRTIRH